MRRARLTRWKAKPQMDIIARKQQVTHRVPRLSLPARIDNSEGMTTQVAQRVNCLAQIKVFEICILYTLFSSPACLE